MHSFQYKGMDDGGKLSTGKMDAVNVADLEIRLQKLGLELVNFKALGAKANSIGSARRISRRELITFTVHFEYALKAGVPILDSLSDIKESSDNPRLCEILAAMVEAITGGVSLSEAMRRYPTVFSTVFVNLVAAGEVSGNMSAVFAKLVADLKWQDEQISMTKKLLIYPLFVGLLVFGVVLFLMIYLVPELLNFIRNTGQEIPLQTKVLIVVSDVFVNYWYLFIAVPVLLTIVLFISGKISPRIYYRMDMLKLSIPLAGPILKKLILARLMGLFAMMYSSGITIIECINSGEKVVGNKAMQVAVKHVGSRIAEGVTLSDSFESAQLFPPLVLRMIRVGERTGELEAALNHIHYFYVRDVKESIANLQTMVEPIMTVLLGTIIAWVVLSVLGPIYDLISEIKV